MQLLQKLLLPKSSIFIHACKAGHGGCFADNFCSMLSYYLHLIRIYGVEENIEVNSIEITNIDNGIYVEYKIISYPIHTFLSCNKVLLSQTQLIYDFLHRIQTSILKMIVMLNLKY